MTRFIGRQGDVLVIQVGDVPDDVTTSKDQFPDRVVLAYGEVTGHSHQIKQDGFVSLVETDAKEVFLSIMGDQGATLVHEEHKAMQLPKGNFKVTIQREHTPEAIQRVVD